MIETIDVKRIVPTEKQYVWTFGGVDPMMRIKPGDVLDLYTEDCFAGKIRSEQDLFSKVCEYPYVNPQTGIYKRVLKLHTWGDVRPSTAERGCCTGRQALGSRRVSCGRHPS